MRYAPKRIYNWSPSIAYSVGLMASDGCLQKNGRHLDLTSKDRQQLLNFSDALQREFYIGTKKSGNGDLSLRIQFSDVVYYDFLVEAGLTPAKSKTLGPLNIPDKFYADFLRGIFDGDGTCHAYLDPRFKSSFMFYTTYSSASPRFIKYLRDKNSKLVGVGKGSLKEVNGIHSLVYAKADSHKLFGFMYYDGHRYSLDRKRIKLHGFIKKDLSLI